ncbi:DEAD/DEAH box helicase family protein [Shewanella profunda]|uniref:DEAD/DEAH box helicase family protein n=1 Tax=Shewanella profunda TaxID=254793 RepID=UPI00200DE6CD|nr:DEAD/DEAH box helicase family protein [Shewanella profunda]MCL1089386.1 DEAD/DEAH box helicase family protein [Shewanella profunda]
MKLLQSLSNGKKLTSGGESDPFLPKLINAINRATSIQISVSFIQQSGLKLIFDALTDALNRNVSISILTSDYLGITDPVALRELSVLQNRGANTRVYVCKQGQSFHMKTYIFVHQKNETISQGCAFIGSNNISRAALTHAVEWCLRHDYSHTGDNSDFEHIQSEFSKIFSHPQVQALTSTWIDEYIERRKPVRHALTLLDMESDTERPVQPIPNSAQLEALDALNNARDLKMQRALVVLATGMGKTWLAAFDVLQTQSEKILFVAHREEILLQAERTFLTLIPNTSTGHYNGQSKQLDAKMIFASIQTLGRTSHLRKFAPDYFDYIIVDEFHHAGAISYKKLLNYFTPKFLLGLTATPERTDQADILSLCDNNLIYEKRITDGIESGILVPFKYYGINDKTINYQDLPWRNGKFDPTALDNVFATENRAKHILKYWRQHKQTRTLAFCTSQKHAEYMAKYFSQHGIKAIAVHSHSEIRRAEALQLLSMNEVDILFSVDLFNEGTDLPAIDTILIIRPTESKILFLQQLGRGLRQSRTTGKSYLTVIDFIGNHISFLNRPMALQGLDTPEEALKNITIPLINVNCFINIAPELVDFWRKLSLSYKTAADVYHELKNQIGRRPTATEFFYSKYDLTKLNRQYGSWFNLVLSEEEDQELNLVATSYLDFLNEGISSTKMTKCFKAILLEAFISLDGFNFPPNIDTLCEQSWHVFKRYPILWQQDVLSELLNVSSTDPKWHQYWKRNPINFLCKKDTKDTKDTKPWFRVEQNKLMANITIIPEHRDLLTELVMEITDLLLARYSNRSKTITTSLPKILNNVVTSEQVNVINLIEKQDQNTQIELSYYQNLKIACGHFKSGYCDQSLTKEIPDIYGKINPEIHFLAPASGNSMNGGKQAVCDGDLLLLEKISPTNAGSINGLTLAIEIQDDSGDNQYLLRKVSKQIDGGYLLIANNPDYAPIVASEEMHTFARLKSIVK